jgi:hypothetical protein
VFFRPGVLANMQRAGFLFLSIESVTATKNPVGINGVLNLSLGSFIGDDLK